MNIIFQNRCHIGDVVASKPFCKQIINILKPQNVYYSHSNNCEIARDMSKYSYLGQYNVSKYSYKIGDGLFINTWFGVLNQSKPNYKCITKYNFDVCHFQRLYDLYQYYSEKQLGIDLSYMMQNPCKYFWDIEQINLQIPFLNDKNKKKVIIYNQKTLSGQTDNEDMRNYIIRLATWFPNIIFYVTSKINVDNLSNLICLTDYYNVKFDLFENSNVSKKCDIIWGPVSGPFMFTWTKTNLLNKNKIFISVHGINAGEAQYCKNIQAKNYHTWTTKQGFQKLKELCEKI